MSGSTLSSKNNKDTEDVVSKLYVKYMVCLRDKMLMQSVLDKQGLNYCISVHGAIEFLEKITKVQKNEIREELSKSGMVLLDEKDSMVIDRIINTIIEVVHYTDALPKLSFRDIFSKHAISGEESFLKIFSDVKGMSVFQFVVNQKIERAKELMLYEDMPLGEIAEILNYKNKGLLVAQFKKTTGLTPDYFKRLKNERMEIADKYINASHADAAGASS